MTSDTISLASVVSFINENDSRHTVLLLQLVASKASTSTSLILPIHHMIGSILSK